jgi:hypothetical protein
MAPVLFGILGTTGLGIFDFETAPVIALGMFEVTLGRIGAGRVCPPRAPGAEAILFKGLVAVGTRICNPDGTEETLENKVPVDEPDFVDLEISDVVEV